MRYRALRCLGFPLKKTILNTTPIQMPLGLNGGVRKELQFCLSDLFHSKLLYLCIVTQVFMTIFGFRIPIAQTLTS